MLTPIEIQRKVLKTGLGYEKKDVDNFLRDVLADYETLYRENVELTDKINTLSEGIQYYKSIEKTLQKALVLAQRTADETKEVAVKQAGAIEKEARAKAELIIADAHRELELLHTQTKNLLQQYDLYKAEFKQLAAAQLELIESDSFKIQVANLDAFLGVNDTKSAPQKQIERPVVPAYGEPEDEASEDEEEEFNEDEELIQTLTNDLDEEDNE